MNKKLILLLSITLALVLIFINATKKEEGKANISTSITSTESSPSFEKSNQKVSKTLEHSTAKVLTRDNTKLSMLEIQSKEKEAARSEPTSDDYVRSATESFEQGKAREGALFLATAAMQMAGYSEGISSPEEFAQVCQVLDRLERTVPVSNEYFLLKAKFLERAQEEQEANKQIEVFEDSTHLSGSDRPCDYLDIYVEGNNTNLVKTFAKKCALSVNCAQYSSVIQQAIENIKNHLGSSESEQLSKQIAG